MTAEVYAEPGIDYARQIAAAQLVKSRMTTEDKVVDVDDTVEAPQRQIHFTPDRDKATLAGISDAAIARTLAIAVAGDDSSTLHVATERNPLRIVLQLPRANRASYNFV